MKSRLCAAFRRFHELDLEAAAVCVRLGEFAADTFEDRGEESWGLRPLAMVELKEKAFRHL